MTNAATLSRAELREIERKLRSSRSRLERAMVRGRAHRMARRARRPASIRASTARSREHTFSPRTLARHEALVAAIRRLESGTYGVCTVCGAPIEHDRLMHSPEESHCAVCSARPADERVSVVSH